MDYIFLSGIHGVGKSTLAAKLKNLIDIESVSVSDLIKKSGKNLDTSTKSTGNIPQNQELWKRELFKLDTNGSILLLDGHFCLLDVVNNPTPLPFSTFEGTNMSKIILMRNTPSIIRDRLMKRDNKDYSIQLLKNLQDCEQKQAMKYSAQKNINLFIYDESQPLSELLNFIAS